MELKHWWFRSDASPVPRFEFSSSSQSVEAITKLPSSPSSPEPWLFSVGDELLPIYIGMISVANIRIPFFNNDFMVHVKFVGEESFRCSPWPLGLLGPPRSRSFVSTVSPQTNSWRGVDGRVELWRFRSENGNPTWFLVESSVSTWSKHDPLCHQMNWHSIVGLLFLCWIIGRHHRIITKRNPQSLTERNIKMTFFFLWFSGFQKCMPLPKKQCFVSNIINHRLKKWLETWLRFILRFFFHHWPSFPFTIRTPNGELHEGPAAPWCLHHQMWQFLGRSWRVIQCKMGHPSLRSLPIPCMTYLPTWMVDF